MNTSRLALLVLASALLACATQRPQQTTTAEPAPAPATQTSVPGADVVTEVTCTDEVWLLTHYEVGRLASGSSPAPGTGYPLVCCAEGVLAADHWRCQVDWPSSDVVGCELFLEYRDALAAAHPIGARSQRVTDNLAGLARIAAEGTMCMTGEGEQP